MNKLLTLLTGFIFFTIGCSGCEATKLETSGLDTTSGVEESDRSWVTWETCGQMEGDNPCDFTMQDQNGDDFSLYDHYGKVIVLDFSTMWCGVCNTMAHDAQVFMNDYEAQGFVWATILVDDQQGDPPDASDLNSWCSIYGIDDAFVLAGDRSIIDYSATTGYPIQAWPTFVVIDREMVLQHGLRGWSETMVRQYVEGLL